MSLISFTKLSYAEWHKFKLARNAVALFQRTCCYDVTISFKRDNFEQVWTRFDVSLYHEWSSLKEIWLPRGCRPLLVLVVVLTISKNKSHLLSRKFLERNEKTEKLNNSKWKNEKHARSKVHLVIFLWSLSLRGRENLSVIDGDDLPLVPIPSRIPFVHILLS